MILRILFALSDFQSVYDHIQDSTFAHDRRSTVRVLSSFFGLWASYDGSFDLASDSASVRVVVHGSLGSIVVSNGKLVKASSVLMAKALALREACYLILYSTSPRLIFSHIVKTSWS